MKYTHLALPVLSGGHNEHDGAIVELIEKTDVEHEVVVPNELRINGQSVHTSADHPILVNVAEPGQSLVEVTVTLLAKRVTIGAVKP